MKEENEIDLPGNDDENVGDGAPKTKKERKKKSREERRIERRVVFLTLLIVLIFTLIFWLFPMIKTGSFSMPSYKIYSPKVSLPKPEWKGYVEYKL